MTPTNPISHGAQVLSAAADDIDFMVELVEAHSPLRIPSENKKNAYTKACWLLAVCQKLDTALGGRYPGMAEKIQTYKDALPILRSAIDNEKK